MRPVDLAVTLDFLDLSTALVPAGVVAGPLGAVGTTSIPSLVAVGKGVGSA